MSRRWWLIAIITFVDPSDVFFLTPSHPGIAIRIEGFGIFYMCPLLFNDETSPSEYPDVACN